MRQIEIDEETYLFLAAKAIAYVERTPGETLKRLLGLTENADGKIEAETNQTNIDGRTKKKKTNLAQLIRAGKLREGERLTFRDYRDNQYPEYEVTVSNGELKWQNKFYSMSGLAKLLLKRLGHTNDYVRGPVFWLTSEGNSVAVLWDEYLNEDK